MRLLVAVKRVPDPYGRIRLTDDGARLDASEARAVVNPYDEIALDAAHALRQGGTATESVAVTVVPARTAAGGYEETLRAALARGADRGLLVTVEGETGPQAVATALADAARREEADLVLCGRQGSDSDDGQTGARVAGLLGWPLLAAAGSVEVDDGGRRVRIVRETDEGTETVEAQLPAVVTCDLRGRDPRPLPLPA
ncbi:MAG TPA: electron transfer flavoprotein subunit beta/FixA family protein, partial [Armatimonadaceae bacterium]|nr:electron transfer flavoprotein subunit beta/FixA family protein [Armatimonadaceae bacterium]